MKKVLPPKSDFGKILVTNGPHLTIFLMQTCSRNAPTDFSQKSAQFLQNKSVLAQVGRLKQQMYVQNQEVCSWSQSKCTALLSRGVRYKNKASDQLNPSCTFVLIHVLTSPKLSIKIVMHIYSFSKRITHIEMQPYLLGLLEGLYNNYEGHLQLSTYQIPNDCCAQASRAYLWNQPGGGCYPRQGKLFHQPTPLWGCFEARLHDVHHGWCEKVKIYICLWERTGLLLLTAYLVLMSLQLGSCTQKIIYLQLGVLT